MFSEYSLPVDAVKSKLYCRSTVVTLFKQWKQCWPVTMLCIRLRCQPSRHHSQWSLRFHHSFHPVYLAVPSAVIPSSSNITPSVFCRHHTLVPVSCPQSFSQIHPIKPTQMAIRTTLWPNDVAVLANHRNDKVTYNGMTAKRHLCGWILQQCDVLVIFRSFLYKILHTRVTLGRVWSINMRNIKMVLARS